MEKDAKFYNCTKRDLSSFSVKSDKREYICDNRATSFMVEAIAVDSQVNNDKVNQSCISNNNKRSLVGSNSKSMSHLKSN